jgi:hypothetical protein
MLASGIWSSTVVTISGDSLQNVLAIRVQNDSERHYFGKFGLAITSFICAR